MVTAVVGAVVFMLLFAGVISRFVERRPTIKMLAPAFLLLIGLVLVAEGWGQYIQKEHIYFSMASRCL